MSKTLLYVIAILLLWLVIVRKNSFTINESVEENKIDVSKTEIDNLAKT